jgi:hypothetical protein
MSLIKLIINSETYFFMKGAHVMNREKIKKVREMLRLKFELKLNHRTIGRMVNASAASVSRCSSPFQQQELNWTQLETMSCVTFAIN